MTHPVQHHVRLKSNHIILPQTPMHRASAVVQPVDLKLTDLCFKIFVVVVVVLAAIVVIVGVLALMAARGGIPGNPHPLKVIGELNSFVMISSGAFLFALGILTWSCQLYKEAQQQCVSKPSTARKLEF